MRQIYYSVEMTNKSLESMTDKFRAVIGIYKIPETVHIAVYIVLAHGL